MSSVLSFYKGQFDNTTNYVDGGVYFDTLSHEIRVGKGAVGSYDSYSSSIKNITLEKGTRDPEGTTSKLVITFHDKSPIEIDYSTAAKADEVEEALSSIVVSLNTKISNITSSNNSLKVDLTTPTSPDMSVKLSEAIGQSLVLKTDGLFVNAPAGDTYTIQRQDSSELGLASVYHLLKNNVQVGDAINIPRDMVIEKGEVRMLTEAEIAAGKGVAGKYYIVLTIAGITPYPAFANNLYVAADNLVDTYKSGSTEDSEVIVGVKNYTITADLNDIVKGKIAKAHTHDNKDVIDTITSEKITLWNTVQNAVKQIIPGSGVEVVREDSTVTIGVKTATNNSLGIVMGGESAKISDDGTIILNWIDYTEN